MTTATAPQEGTMKVWIVQVGERWGAMDIAWDDANERALVFADTEEGYNGALAAFRALVDSRLGGTSKAVFSYPGEFGPDARAHILAQDMDQYGEFNDSVELRPFDVLAG
jgi:hypothetical protein